MNRKQLLLLCALWMSIAFPVLAIDHPGITTNTLRSEAFTLLQDAKPTPILMDAADQKGINIAVTNLAEDFRRVSGTQAEVLSTPRTNRFILVGSLESKYIQQLVKNDKLDVKMLQGKNEQYLITCVKQPFEDVEEALVIVGSDRRGTIYGTYELSEQIGVSPWYWWADVPVVKQQNLAIERGNYTAGEPAVKYRGLFFNDEAPCLTNWVKHAFGTNYGGHEFYAKCFELILRLRGNFLWPAMWCWTFYADDPLNSKVGDEMGVVISTSHHEPMARNHQEWSRHRKEYGAWNYVTNQKIIDQFFSEGIRRMKDTEDVVTIGMRGDGDGPMSEDADTKLLERIIRNQRKIIARETGRPAEETPQVWALYKEVQDYYDKGLRVPDDVIMLLADDNWGNVRRLPNAEERKHLGGWGMYYHVDYVGTPRNSKWLNVTPIQNMWEQLSLTYEYGVDKLWVLNVGDLKPMEYPISLFMDMAWRPQKYTVETLLEHPYDFCKQIFGETQAAEAARILNLYSKYNGRVTGEMLDAKTYNLETGEWKQVRDEYICLEAEALRQYNLLAEEYKDAYKQLILFPVQAMANLYDMYYSQAMNHALYKAGNPACNQWADRVEQTFKRNAALADDYNNVMSGGKWKHMMSQKHIGYKTWNDDFKEDTLPEIFRMDAAQANREGGYVFTAKDGMVAMEAEHYFSKQDAADAKWTTIPYMGRTLSGVTLMPRLPQADGASLTYKMHIPQNVKEVTIHVVVKSTLAFARTDGHRYTVVLDGGEPMEVNFNHNLNEKKENIYSIFYPTVGRRVVESKMTVPLKSTEQNLHTLTLKPLDPGIVFEKIVVDYGGYKPAYLFGDESPYSRSVTDY